MLTRLSLSAYLYEATGNSTYLDAAELSATFIISQLYQRTIGAVILNSISIATCTPDYVFVTDGSGFTIEGLSVLAPRNSTFTPM